MITAPYNFVPLSEKVVKPFWAKKISHDIPFEDSKSGTLKLKIKAESPIFVRNGMPRNASEEDPKKNNFNNINNNYFIPGSSVKGMLRSVVEIMSFAIMKNKVNQHKYSVRDFQNNNIYPKSDLSNQVESGWLYKVGDEYFIDKCGKPGRISHKNLDILCGNQKISTYYKDARNVQRDRDKSAKSKNDNFNFNRKQNFSLDYEDNGRKIFKVDPSGNAGTIVLTGQAGVRKEPEFEKASGKHLEFIFWDKEPTQTPVSEDVINNFFFAYYDHDLTNQKEDWKWRKPQIEKGEKIPVFYRTHTVNGKEEFLDVGLTMLYKITYKHSILDSINNQQKDADSYDLAEAIFGYVDDKKALKGRVHIGHAFVSNGTPTPLEEKMEVLAGPKASYYPNYIEQASNKDGKVKRYNTFMDDKAKIKGWKRYPVRLNDTKTYELPKRKDGSINYDVVTKFIPLPASTEFEFDLSYHNLRIEELGALLSAITFHNTEGLFHSIGSAKPLGYGKIKLTIEEGLSQEEQIEAMKAYEAYMDYALEHSTPLWFQLEQIKELFAMAKPGDEDDKLKYMELKDFVNVKGRGRNSSQFALQKYSLISKNNVEVRSLITNDELNESNNKYTIESASFEKSTDINKQKEELITQMKAKLSEKIENIKDALLADLKQKKKELEDKIKEEKEKEEQLKRDERRRKEQEEAQERGFVLSEDFDFEDRKAFDNLSKEITDYASKLHKINNSKQLSKLLKDKTWLLETDFEYGKDVIEKVYKELSQNEVKKWKKKPIEKNFAYKKVALWIGHDQAKNFFEELTKD